MDMVKLSFKKEKVSFELLEGIELLQAYKMNPCIPLRFGCCEGNCGVCAIEIAEGENNLSRMTKKERKTLQEKNLLEEGYRLACQCAIKGDVVIDHKLHLLHKRKL